MSTPLTKKDLERFATKADLSRVEKRLDRSLQDLNTTMTKQLAATKREIISQITREIGKLHEVLVTRPQLEQLVDELHKHGVDVDRKAIFAD